MSRSGISYAAGVAVATALLAGCGGGGDHKGVTAVRPPIVPLNPVYKRVPGLDPDVEQRASTEVNASVIRRGEGRFRVLVQNTSQIGFINAFDWLPPPGVKITSVGSTSVGHCDLHDNTVSCRATLRPPKCTCLPGGSMTFDFTAKIVRADVPDASTGFYDANVIVRSMTPVPYIIPSHLGATPRYSDLPICKVGQESTKDAPCIHSGAG